MSEGGNNAWCDIETVSGGSLQQLSARIRAIMPSRDKCWITRRGVHPMPPNRTPTVAKLRGILTSILYCTRFDLVSYGLETIRNSECRHSYTFSCGGILIANYHGMLASKHF